MKSVPTFLLLTFGLASSALVADDAKQLLEQGHTTGGLVVHVGAGDGTLAADIAAARPSLIVQALDGDAAAVTQARAKFRESAAAARLSAEVWKRNDLPHAEDLVNLLLLDDGTKVSKEEAMRVLAPGGTVMRKNNGAWTAETKPHAPKTVEWTHYQYDAANNPVGEDKSCGLPRRFQWAGTPLWSTAHESMASLNAMVSANGRVFYIMDEGARASVQLASDWQLVARDAYNGVVLWKKPLTQWLTRFWPWKSGPAQMPRKLIAIGDRVYAPLDINGPLIEFDAATGEQLHVYDETAAAEEVISTQGILLVVSNPTPPDMKAIEEDTEKRRHFSYDGRNRVVLDHSAAKNVVAVEAKTGKVLWKHAGPQISVLTLAALGDNVVYHDGFSLVCLDLKTGAQKWKSAPIAQTTKPLFSFSEESPTVVLNDKAVYYAWNRKLTTVSLADGKQLWEAPWVDNDYRSPVSVMLMQDLVWSMNIASAKSAGTFMGRDLITGEVKKEFDLPPFKGIGHHRCYKAKASGDFVLLSRSGVEYVNPTDQSYSENHWIRGACLYGILPANGLLYSTPHACACYIKGKLNGFTAMSPGLTETMKPAKDKADPIEQGPSYLTKVEAVADPQGWPTYRHDVTRSGHSKTTVTTDLKQTWKTPIGGELTSLVVAEGLAVVAQKDRNTVIALDAETGAPKWRFTAGGMVDSPPTIDHGFVYFGSTDGCVYRLLANDGSLCWRTRAAPDERRVVAYGRLESAWPVHGSVLVENGIVYAAAGRSSFLDGGIRMVKIKAQTGEFFGDERVYDMETGTEPPVTGSFEMDGALPDILSSQDGMVFMRHRTFDKESLSQRAPAPHLYSPTGYLDDNWWHRTYWVYGEDTKSGYGGWWQSGNKLPAGRILVVGDDAVYGFGRNFYAGQNSAQFSRGEKYVLSASEKRAGAEPDFTPAMKDHKEGTYLKTDWTKLRTTPVKWSDEIPFSVRAMVLAGDTLFAAGPYGDAIRSDDAFTGKRGVRLAAAATKDGKLLASYAIDAMPVFDGLVAANGRLYLAMQDGSVACYGAQGKTLESKLGEPIEVLPEELLPDDNEYRKEFQEKLGITDFGNKGNAKGKGKAAPAKRAQITGEDISYRFAKVTGGKVVSCELGYRLAADENSVSQALYEFGKPVTTKTTWTFKMQRTPGFPNPPYYGNGFFVLGDGTNDEQLIKCGMQFIQGRLVIFQGATPAQKGEKIAFEGDASAVIELSVTFDPDAQTITLTSGKQTLTAKLAKPLKQITHTGFATWKAVTDFGALGQE
ncbi:MAG: PQQ-binding-like beta-propeller repeat protein [Prosthecobacter sp.]